MLQVDHNSPNISTDEDQLIQFRNRCLEEYRSTREQLGIGRRNDRAAKFLNGDGQWPRDLREQKRYFAAITLNIIRSVVLRKTGALTEARAQLNILSQSGNEQAANTLKKTTDGVWTERNMQQQLTDGIVMAQRDGNAACVVLWNPDLDYGRGDIDIRFIPGEQIAYDPAIRRASDLQKAEWVCISNVRPVEEFKVIYPRRGHLVKAERNLSTYDGRYTDGGIIKTPVPSLLSVWKKRGRKDEYQKDGAIPRATEHLLYFRDRTLNPAQPFLPNEDGIECVPNYLFPRKRLTVSVGNVVLYDGESKYWDGNYPAEILDWGIEIDHPFGESEVDTYRSVQEAVNSLVSGAVHNARIMNNPPKKITGNIDPDMANDLELYGDEPGRVWNVDNPDDVTEFLVKPYTAEVLSVVEALMQAVELMSGLSEASQGTAPAGVTAASALDQLITAAQTILRLEGRSVEDFLGRLGQLIISRIIQFYTGERTLHYFGADGEVLQAVYQREQFIAQLRQANPIARTQLLEDTFRDFTFKVTPFSSLEASRQRDLQIKMLLKQMGLLPDIEILKAARIPDPEQRLQEARAEQGDQLKMAMMMKAAASSGGAGGGGKPPAGGGGGAPKPQGHIGRVPNSPQPAAMRAGVGGMGTGGPQ